MDELNKKDLNFEVNLLPVISVLAVCICGLMTVAAWDVVSSLELKQGTGSVGILSDRTPIAVVSLHGSEVEVQLKNSTIGHKVRWSAQDPNLATHLSRDLSNLRRQVDGLNAAMVLSSKTTSYQKIVSTLEVLKTAGFAQVGLSSL